VQTNRFDKGNAGKKGKLGTQGNAGLAVGEVRTSSCLGRSGRDSRVS